MISDWMKWVGVLVLILFVFWMLEVNPITWSEHMITSVVTFRDSLHKG